MSTSAPTWSVGCAAPPSLAGGGGACAGIAESFARVAQLTESLSTEMGGAIDEIGSINSRAGVLALNASIEAARAGEEHGAAFAVVAGSMKELSDRTSNVARDLARKTKSSLGDFARTTKSLSRQVRGMRLSDLALMNIDLIDRNLYERSCDVRWWATDSSLVDALTNQTDDAYQHASQRMSVILRAYTVYYDLVLCDLQGRVVARGRADEFGENHESWRDAEWFRSALATKTGDEFGFESVHRSTLVGDRRVLVYSCAVRERGESRGKPLGALGIVFNWDGLAQTVVERTPLSEEEWKQTRVAILDSQGLLLADTAGQALERKLNFSDFDGVTDRAKDYTFVPIRQTNCCVAHAFSPGFETYSTGWHSLIIQQTE
jgi:hypothetical protein